MSNDNITIRRLFYAAAPTKRDPYLGVGRMLLGVYSSDGGLFKSGGTLSHASTRMTTP
jgi:hypothetical protein